jgi:RNA recognition motif-containing protein
MNIYVGNLSRTTTEEALRQAFETHGSVTKVNIITDRYSGDSRGFGFVEMPEQSEAEAAIAALNGQELDGWSLKVNVAKPRNEGQNRTRRSPKQW